MSAAGFLLKCPNAREFPAFISLYSAREEVRRRGRPPLSAAEPFYVKNAI